MLDPSTTEELCRGSWRGNGGHGQEGEERKKPGLARDPSRRPGGEEPTLIKKVAERAGWERGNALIGHLGSTYPVINAVLVLQ